MKKVTRCYRKLQRTFLQVATVVGLAGFMLIPTISSNTSAKIKAAIQSSYKIMVNGQEMGYASSYEEANQAYLDARTRLNAESGGVAYVDAQVSVSEYKKEIVIETKETIEQKIYEALSSQVVNSDKVTSYVVRIDDFTVTLASKEDVVKVLENVKSSYDVDNMFQVSIKTDNEGKMSVEMQSAEIIPLAVDKVAAMLDGETVSPEDFVGDSEIDIKEGLIALGFAEDIEIIETAVTSDVISTVEDASDAITKEKAEKETYTIVAGDCLYNIAVDHGMTVEQLLTMNEGMTESSMIRPGDKIVVTVPKPELSVVTVVTETYEEEYNAPVQYVEDSSLYVGQTAVSIAGTPGYRSVDAVVTYRDGVAVASSIINERVISEPVAKVVRKGTKVAPTYIVPIAWYNYISEEYGWRSWTNSFHNGLDFAAPYNTVIRASRGGYVSYAGWKGSFGNCVEITHPDGHMTRYAHMNSIAVSYGQTVSQWDTIGYCGSTGFTTGPHLHFELYIGGSAVNPRKWLTF